MRIRYLCIAALFLGGCDYERSNFLDPEYEGDAEIRFTTIGEAQLHFSVRFSEDQGFNTRFVWTSNRPDVLRFLPPCTVEPPPCGEGIANVVASGTAQVTAQYVDREGEVFPEVSYTRQVSVWR
jgi:hypothetical protein